MARTSQKFIDTMAANGLWLFRWRSYLPLVTVVLFAIGFLQFRYWLGSSRADAIWDFMSLGVAMLGQGMRVVIVAFVPKGTSGRGTKQLNASELNTTAAYSIVRHPLYVANFVIWFGVLLFFHSAMLVATGSLLYRLYYERIIVTGEALLEERFGPAFSAWVERTPALLPHVPWHWRHGNHRFSWRSVLRREYSTLFAIVSVFTFMEVASGFMVERRFQIDRTWVVIFAIGALQYLMLRTIKKTSSLLNDA